MFDDIIAAEVIRTERLLASELCARCGRRRDLHQFVDECDGFLWLPDRVAFDERGSVLDILRAQVRR